MPSTAGIVASGSAQLDQWLRAHLVAFDERRADPLTNLGTLGSAGDAVATGTRRLVNTGTKAFVWLPGVTGNGLSVLDPAELASAGAIDFRYVVAADDYTPAATQVIAVQGDGNLATTSFRVIHAGTSGLPSFQVSDGSAWRAATASRVFGVADGMISLGRVTWTGSTGAFTWEEKVGVPDADAMTELASSAGWSLINSGTMASSPASLLNSTAVVTFGTYFGGTSPFGGGFHGASIATTIGGAPFLTVDPSVLTDEGATSFTATTGQTVTINRSTGTGYKTEIVLPGSGSRLLNGTSDFLEVADNDALDFSAAQSFTPWALIRQWGTPGSSAAFMQKGNSPGARWGLVTSGASLALLGLVNDGTNSGNDTSGAYAAGALSLLASSIDRSANTNLATVNGVASSAATSLAAVGTLVNANTLRVGTNPAGIGFQHFRLHAWGIYPGALTAAQLAALRDALLVPERAAA